MSKHYGTNITPNAFLHFPKPSPTNRIPTIFFFITGNPGLIGYYHEFLNLLCQPDGPDRTASSSDDNASNEDGDHQPTTRSSLIAQRCVVAGFSLGGFDMAHESTSGTSTSTTNLLENEDKTPRLEHLKDLQYPSSFTRANNSTTYSLNEQIELCHARITALAHQVHELYHPQTSPPQPPKPINIVLSGHSVGGHIALEVIRKHHSHTHTHATSTSTITISIQIRAAQLLTPTIQHIAHSASGRIATPLLTYIPFLSGLAQLGATTLSTLLSAAQVRWLVSRVTGMEERAAALDWTVRFLRTRGAVRQALDMARDEMGEIGELQWADEVWGVVAPASGAGGEWTVPRLYLWFAREDHWVAGTTRDEILNVLQERFGRDGDDDGGGGNGSVKHDRPVVVVDEDEGLVHAWCLMQNKLVSQRVRLWLEEVLVE